MDRTAIQQIPSPAGEGKGEGVIYRLLREYTNSTANRRYQFRSKERDAETNYDDFGARLYARPPWRNARIARLPGRQVNWLQVDPLALKAPSESPYSYCFNNPIKMYDPDGRWPWVANENIGANIVLKDLLSGALGNQVSQSDLSNFKFMPAYNIIADRAPKVAEYLKNDNVPVIFMENLQEKTRKTSARGMARMGEVGMLLNKNLLGSSVDLASAMLHEAIHNLGGNEFSAYGVQLATGLRSANDYLSIIGAKGTDLDAMTGGMPNELIVRMQNYQSSGRKEDGEYIINALEKEGQRWLKDGN